MIVENIVESCESKPAVCGVKAKNGACERGAGKEFTDGAPVRPQAAEAGGQKELKSASYFRE